MLGAVAEFERSMISERTKTGIESARKRGHQLGRPRFLTLEQRHEINLWRVVIGRSCKAFRCGSFYHSSVAENFLTHDVLLMYILVYT